MGISLRTVIIDKKQENTKNKTKSHLRTIIVFGFWGSKQ